MPQIHLQAEPGDYAPLVLMPGDPNRATRVAEMLDGGLDKTRMVNDHRKLMGYTGTWQGKPVSVQTSGIGTPSLAIVTEELLRLGARSLIRIGTCGAIGAGIRTGDIIIATSSTPLDGTTREFVGGDPLAPTPDFFPDLTTADLNSAVSYGYESVKATSLTRSCFIQKNVGPPNADRSTLREMSNVWTSSECRPATRRSTETGPFTSRGWLK